MPELKYEERRAGVCAYLCISIASSETSYISLDDCFAAFCLVYRDWLSPPRKTKELYHKIAANRQAVLRISAFADSFAWS